MNQNRILILVLILLVAIGYVIAWHWYDIAKVLIRAGFFLWENTIQDTQNIKAILFASEGFALLLVTAIVFRKTTTLGLRVASAVYCVLWCLLCLAHSTAVGMVS